MEVKTIEKAEEQTPTKWQTCHPNENDNGIEKFYIEVEANISNQKLKGLPNVNFLSILLILGKASLRS